MSDHITITPAQGTWVVRAGGAVLGETTDALELRGSERLEDCDLWVTLEPCTMCAGAIAHARIRRLYFAARDEKAGAVESGVRFFDSPSCHHHPEIYGGLSEAAAAAQLRAFFEQRR